MNGWIANHPCIPAILKTRVLTHTQVTPTIDVVCVCVFCFLPFELLFNNRKWNTNDSTWQGLSCSMISAIITIDLASIPSFFCNIQWIPRHNWFGINGYYLYHAILYHIISYHIISYHIIAHIKSYNITYQIISYYIPNHIIIMYHIIYHHIIILYHNIPSDHILVGGLEHLFFHILGMSLSQLTNSYCSEG